MNTHKHARLTPYSRALLVRRITEEGLSPREAAQAMGVSTRTAYKWLRRYREEGAAGLLDRSSRPRHHPAATPPQAVEQAFRLRRARQTYRQISQTLGISLSTVGRLLRRAGLHRLAALEPAPPERRYEHAAPGGLLHLDIKKLGRFARPGHRVTGHRQQASRGAGWEYIHVAIDDHWRIAFASRWPDETARSVCRALLQAVRYFAALGIRFRRVLTDNGPGYRSRRFRRLCRRLGLKRLYPRPYTPRTNGKAERFIQTLLRKWAYARTYQDADHRARHLPAWLHHYNWHRPHASLGYAPPVSRAPLPVNNLVALHS